MAECLMGVKATDQIRHERSELQSHVGQMDYRGTLSALLREKGIRKPEPRKPLVRLVRYVEMKRLEIKASFRVKLQGKYWERGST